MKKSLYILLLLLPISILLISCEIETSGNGKLDGNWQLQSFDTLSTGGICDMSESTIYWGIENKILQIRNIKKAEKILFRFEKSGSTLTITNPHLYDNRKYETTPIEDKSVLLPFGIQDIEETYTIEQLSNSCFVLKNQQLRLHFRKY